MTAEQPYTAPADLVVDDADLLAQQEAYEAEQPDQPTQQPTELSPAEFNEKHLIAVDHSKNGRHRSALPLYEELAAVSYAPPEVHYNVAVTLRHLGRHQDALKPLTRFLGARPNDFQAWTNAGDSLREIGNHAAAMEMFRYALHLAPLSWDGIANLAAAHHNISRELLAMNEMDGALYHAKQACILNPNDPDHLCGLAEIQLMLGDFGEGWANYEARIAKNEADAKQSA